MFLYGSATLLPYNIMEEGYLSLLNKPPLLQLKLSFWTEKKMKKKHKSLIQKNK